MNSPWWVTAATTQWFCAEPCCPANALACLPIATIEFGFVIALTDLPTSETLGRPISFQQALSNAHL